MQYQVFTDGSSSRKNKTIGTSYIVFKDKSQEPIQIFSKGFFDREARNGIAELLGVYYFLKDLCCNENLYTKENSEIIIYSDSQYVVNEYNIWYRNQMMKNFWDTKNKEVIIYTLWMLYILRNEGYTIKFEWIRGHQKENNFEVYGNNYADLLSRKSHNEVFENYLDVNTIVENLKKDIKEEETLKQIQKWYLGMWLCS